MKLPQWIIALTLILLATQDSLAQLSPSRTALSVGGTIKSPTGSRQRFSLQQSIGQSGVIGTVGTNSLLLRQGFIQPDLVQNEANNLRLQAAAYPNPFSEDITISIREDVNVSVMVHDLMGRTVHTSSHYHEATIHLHLPLLTSGMYVIRVQSGSKSFSTLLKKN